MTILEEVVVKFCIVHSSVKVLVVALPVTRRVPVQVLPLEVKLAVVALQVRVLVTVIVIVGDRIISPATVRLAELDRVPEYPVQSNLAQVGTPLRRQLAELAVRNTLSPATGIAASAIPPSVVDQLVAVFHPPTIFLKYLLAIGYLAL